MQDLQLKTGQGEGLTPKAEDLDGLNSNRRKGPFRGVDQVQVGLLCSVFLILFNLMREPQYRLKNSRFRIKSSNVRFFSCLFVKCSVFLSKMLLNYFSCRNMLSSYVGRNDFFKYGIKSMF